MAKFTITIVFCLILITSLICLSCVKKPLEDNQVTGASIQELKQTACEAAENADTCRTRLPELGFVTNEECCELFGKCCK